MVREAMYKSVFEALKVKSRIQALRIPGRCLMCASRIARTKGEADALAVRSLANASSLELYGTSMPKKNTAKQ